MAGTEGAECHRDGPSPSDDRSGVQVAPLPRPLEVLVDGTPPNPFPAPCGGRSWDTTTSPASSPRSMSTSSVRWERPSHSGDPLDSRREGPANRAGATPRRGRPVRVSRVEAGRLGHGLPIRQHPCGSSWNSTCPIGSQSAPKDQSNPPVRPTLHSGRRSAMQACSRVTHNDAATSRSQLVGNRSASAQCPTATVARRKLTTIFGAGRGPPCGAV